MKATITINMDNDAFGDYPEAELADILRKLAARVVLGVNTGEEKTLFDYNGNTVGKFEVTED